MGQTHEDFIKTASSLPAASQMGMKRIDPMVRVNRTQLPPHLLQNIKKVVGRSTPAPTFYVLRNMLADENMNQVFHPTVEEMIGVLQHIPEYPAENKLLWEYTLLCWTIDWYNIPRAMGPTQCYFGNFGDAPSTYEALFPKMKTNIFFAREQVFRSL